MKKIVILNSGGLDSFIMTKMAQVANPDAEIIEVYFDIGHGYNWKELQQLNEETIVHDLSWFSAKGHVKDGNGMNNIFIPGRNMMFAVLAACKYLPDEIWLGALPGEIHDAATDKNITFRDMLNNVLEYVLKPFKENVKLVYPFVDSEMNKLDITAWAVHQGYTKEVINSASCMDDNDVKCGHCGVCLRRAGIFMQVGLSESYVENPWSHADTRQIIHDTILAEIHNDDSHYDWNRRVELIPALRLIHYNKTLEEILKQYE